MCVCDESTGLPPPCFPTRFNCVTEDMFTQAIEEARAQDRYLASVGSTKGPLHGIPFSVKECIRVRGTHSTLGLRKYYEEGPADMDSALVEMMRAAGGIPLCKSNIPQTMLSFECSNPVWGVTVNPWMAGRVPGGSRCIYVKIPVYIYIY